MTRDSADKELANVPGCFDVLAIELRDWRFSSKSLQALRAPRQGKCCRGWAGGALQLPSAMGQMIELT